MKIIDVKTELLVPFARNAKKHSPEQVASIAASIKDFGFNNPVLIDKNNGIIAGHGRVMAAKEIGRKTVPCVRLGHLTENQKRAYIIADNRLAELGGGWDVELLNMEIEEINFDEFEEFELADFGDLADLESDIDEPDVVLPPDDPRPDLGVELNKKYKIKAGDLYAVGDHRLLCGDCSDSSGIASLMGQERAQIIFTDPPYGVSIAKKNRLMNRVDCTKGGG